MASSIPASALAPEYMGGALASDYMGGLEGPPNPPDAALTVAPRRRVWRQLWRRKTAVVGLVLAAVVLI